MKERLLACLMILLSNAAQGYLLSADNLTWNLYGDDSPIVAEGPVEKEAEEVEYRLKMLTSNSCGPCRQMKANFDRLGISHRNYGRPQVYTVDIEEHPDEWKSSGERYIPCFILEKYDGEEWREVDKKRRKVGGFDARKIFEIWPELPKT